MVIHPTKNKLIPWAQMSHSKKVALSGANVIRKSTGRPNKEFEFHTKTVYNRIWALQRQLSAQQSIDPMHLEDFRTMCDEWLPELTGRINAAPFQPRRHFDYAEG